MRHSKSCSNHLRQSDLEISSQIRDPGLTELGHRRAAEYGPVLQKKLQVAGFNTRNAIVCSSTLQRAKDTARLVFGRDPMVLSGFAENGGIPENTPHGRTYKKPEWNTFLEHLRTLVKDGDSVAVVGHGSYLRSLWPRLTGSTRKERLNNMDGILCVADLTEDGLRVFSHTEIAYSGPSMHTYSDTCSADDTEKITRLSSMKGGANMPLALFKDGAQMQGTYAEATGAQPAAWFRPALTQSGGKKTKKTKKTRKTRRAIKQDGGFTPSVMGSFATNGLRLMPVAAYMGYKMYSGKTRTTRKAKKSKTRRQRRARN